MHNYLIRKNENIKLQYTLTLLPFFMVPYSKVLFDNTLKAIDNYIGNEKSNQIIASNELNFENTKSFRLFYSRIQKRILKWIAIMAQLITQMGGTIDEAQINDNRIYINPLHSNWLLFNHYIKIYFEIYATLSGTEIIPDVLRHQVIFDLLNRKNMGLGP